MEPRLRSDPLLLQAPDRRVEPALGETDAVSTDDEALPDLASDSKVLPAWLVSRPSADCQTPGFSSEPAAEVVTPRPSRATPPREPKIIALRVMKAGGQKISGRALIDALQAEGLRYGDYKIYHRRCERPAVPGSYVATFSVANIVEPGELDPDVVAHGEVAGVAVFMVLPGPRPGPATFVDMLGTARRIAAAVGGELLDENGSTMTRQTADQVREEIIEFERRSAGSTAASANDR